MYKKYIVVFLVVLAVLMVGGLLYLSSTNSGGKLVSPGGSGKNTPKAEDETVVNPLNGVLVPKSEEDKVLKRRPLFVMVGNNVDGRPQSGVSQADMVYEVVAEGGITRFLPVFLQNEPEKVGPIRSVRIYFLNWVKELGDAMIMHDGGSSSPIPNVGALDVLDSWGIRSLFHGGLYGFRTSDRLAPNNEYISVKTARAKGDELGWQGVKAFDSWLFKEDSNKVYASKPSAVEINVIFWTAGDYESKWVYDSTKNVYMKFTGGVAHKDQETGVQLSAKDVIVQFAKETAVGDEKNHLLYANIGTGKALIFEDGKVIEATWAKPDRESRTKFYDTDGKEVQFNRGTVWVDVVPDRNENQVTYK